jgi:spermidine synthase
MTKLQKYIVGSLFFASGMTSLVYETLWIRVLSLGVGSTSASMSLVLAIFFLGLTLGSWIAGSFASQVRNPVRIYGVLEGVIGLYSLGLIYILFDFHRILALLPVAHSLTVLGLAIKFVLIFLVLILPTTLMGASLPFLIRIFVRNNDSIGRKISFLYGINTLGGVTGAFATGFVLIPKVGVLNANHITAAVNFLILLLALVVARAAAVRQEVQHPAPEHASEIRTRPSLFVRSVPFTVCLTGFASLAAEVVWNKYLGIFLGSNIFGLSLVLALFLMGIAVGAIAFARWIERVENRQLFYIDLLWICGVGIFATSVLLGYAPVLASLLEHYFPKISMLTMKSVIVAVIMLLPASLLGALLPTAIRLCIAGFENAPKVTGRIYALSTIGSILGSGIAGLFLIPWLGSSLTIKTSVVLMIACAAGLTVIVHAAFWSKLGRGVALLAAVLMLAGTDAVSFKNIIKSAYSQTASEDMSLSEALKYYSKTYEEFRLIVEGRTGIISLSHDPQDGENYRDYLRLKTNGLNESVYYTKNLESLPKYEALLGLLPFTLVRNPQRAFAVGYGGGYTVDFLTSSDLHQVDVAELEEGILKAADYVYQGENPILQRKNLNLQIEDARFVLSGRTKNKYDIIVSQPSHSWLAGVANLFTLEFFHIVKDNLTDQGVFSQWLNLYNMNPTVLKSILKTFFAVFPHGAIFTGAGDQEMILIGSNNPVVFNVAKLEAMSRNPKLQRQLAYIPVNNAYDLMTLFTMGRNDVLKLSADAPLNTDRNAYAEVKQSQLFYDARESDPNRFLLEHFTGDYSEVLKADADTTAIYNGLLESMDAHAKDFYKSNRLLDQLIAAREAKPLGNQLALTQIGKYAVQSERYATAREWLSKSLEAHPSVDAFNALLGVLLTIRDYPVAEKLWNRYSLRDSVSTCYSLSLFTGLGKWPQADQVAKKLIQSKSGCGLYLEKALGLYYAKRGDFVPARKHLEAYYQEVTHDMEVYRALLSVYLMTDDHDNSTSFADALTSSWDAERERLKVLADYYRSENYLKDADIIDSLRE